MFSVVAQPAMAGVSIYDDHQAQQAWLDTTLKGLNRVLSVGFKVDRGQIVSLTSITLNCLDQFVQLETQRELTQDELFLLAGYMSLSRLIDEVDERVYQIPERLMSFPTVCRDITQEERLVFREMKAEGVAARIKALDGKKTLWVMKKDVTTHLGTPYNEAWFASTSKNHVGLIDFLSGVTQRTLYKLDGKLCGWVYQ